jgi:hypothetical protein
MDKIKHKNIINFIRAQRLGWLGHIERMQETRMVKAVHSWKPISKRPIGRPKTRWEDDVGKDIQKLKIPNWKTLVQDRRRWNWPRRPKLCIKSCRAIRRRSKHLFGITIAMFLSPSALTLAHTTDSIHVWYSDI